MIIKKWCFDENKWRIVGIMQQSVGYNPSLQAFRAETMVDGLPRASNGIVEWLHRRVIPGEGQLLKRMPLSNVYVFDVLGRLALVQGHILRNPQDWSIRICHGLVLSWYERLAFRNKKVIRTQATGSMTPENWWNFVAKIDVSLELEMHVWSPETLGNDHLGLWKTTDLPDLRFTSDL